LDLDINDIPSYLKYSLPFENNDLKPLKEVEKEYIQKVLYSVNNNKTKAAEILQIDRKTLRQKLS
jgi:DNA-binding protein Fis